MINTTEPRVNNWVRYFGKYKKVRAVADTWMAFYEEESNKPNFDAVREDVEPIPLTPEPLEKCGFAVDKLGYHKKKLTGDNWMGIWIEDAIWIYNEATTQYNEITLTKPEHLHQLQNLYFALTGEELEVSLP